MVSILVQLMTVGYEPFNFIASSEIMIIWDRINGINGSYFWEQESCSYRTDNRNG